MEKEFEISKTNFNHSSYNELYQKNNNNDKLKQKIKNSKKTINNFTNQFHQLNLKDLSTDLTKVRKYSKDSEGLSTSSEDNNKDKEIMNKDIKLSKNIDIKNEPYKGNAFDFKKKYKTELCKYYEINGYCKFGEKCVYAHGKENLRLKVTNTSAYRTKKCNHFFENGYCPYGNRCQFAHQLKSNIINNPFDKKMSYTKILEILSKIECIENVQTIAEKPRLRVFREIVRNEDDNKSRLFNDIKELAFNGIIYYYN